MNNIIILDDPSGAVLYGHVLIKVLKGTGLERRVKIYNIPAEAWIALLHNHYNHLPEVQRYLAAVEAGELIDPQKGALLKAVDEVIDLSEEQADWLQAFVEANR